MSYLVLARKYRPQTFAEVVQQQQVTTTLTNAITVDRVAHAVLFTGPRGTGKTTIARILAKAMNCETGPTPTPCNQCQSCLGITSGHAVDVFEIDGASNNSVDEVRELRSNIKFMPAHSPYKIYIIDEVHMLTKPAFNALLKTLEEPPPHVMFLFATTEPHKIPATILSRCQRHDLTLVDMPAVIAHLEKLCQKEGFTIAEKSLELIAREAGGSIRDSLSLLDQVMSCGSQDITHEMLLDILGIIDREAIFDLSQAVLSYDIKSSLDILESTYQQGHDIKKLYLEITEHFRNLLVIKLGQKTEGWLTVPAHEIERIKEQTAETSEIFLSQIVALLLAEEERVRFSSRPKIAVEMVFIKLLQAQPALPVDALVEKIEALKNQFLSMDCASPTAESAPVAPPSVKYEPSHISDSFAPPSVSEPANPPAAPPPPPEEPELPSQKQPDKSPQETSPPPICDLNVSEVWEKILTKIDGEYPQLAANLTNSTLSEIDGNTLEIEVYGSQINLNMLQREKSLANLKNACTEILQITDIVIKINQQKSPEVTPATSVETKKPVKMTPSLVSEAQEIFGGKIIDTKYL